MMFFNYEFNETFTGKSLHVVVRGNAFGLFYIGRLFWVLCVCVFNSITIALNFMTLLLITYYY